MKRTIRPGEYAKELRRAMRLLIDPTTDRPLTRRGLERMSNEAGAPYSYEHIRKVLAGEPVQSEECNRVLCEILRLDTDNMWTVAQAEKSIRRFGAFPTRLAAPDDGRLREIWPRLSDDDKEDILRVAQGRISVSRLFDRRRAPDNNATVERRHSA